MIKFPSASAGGTTPSGNSLAVTNPGVLGSRPGGVGRAFGADGGSAPIRGTTPAIRLIKNATLKRFVLMESYESVCGCRGRTHAVREECITHSGVRKGSREVLKGRARQYRNAPFARCVGSALPN